MDLGVFLQLTVPRSGAPFTRPARSVLADSSHITVSQLPAFTTEFRGSCAYTCKGQDLM